MKGSSPKSQGLTRTPRRRGAVSVRPGIPLLCLGLSLLSTAAVPADPPAADYRLDRIRIENDGGYFRLSVPLEAPWAHWTLDDPPRIVLDLGQTTSYMPKAPGLYQVRLDRGPVTTLRTSQFRYAPLDHRARITLELSESVPYEARRVGQEIQILIPDPEPRVPAALVLGSDGLSVATAATPPGTAGSSRETGQRRTEELPARTLREALELLGRDAHVSVEPLAGSAPDEPFLAGDRPEGNRLRRVASRPVTSEPPKAEAPAPDSASRRPLPAAAKPAQPPLEDPLLDTKTLLETLVRGLEQGPAGSDSSLGSPSEGAASGGAPSVEASTAEVRERAALRLLQKAVAACDGGDEEKAITAADRAFKFYRGTTSGDQAGLLLRELFLVHGERVKADLLTGIPELPDTTRIPPAVFLRMVERQEQQSDFVEVDRLLRTWGPQYDPIPELARLRVALGEAFLRARKTDLAREHLEQIPQGDENEPRGLLLLARLHDESGEKQKALELYRRAAALPASLYQLRGLARAADLEFQTGLVEEALASYSLLLESRPPSDEEAWAVYQVSNCHFLLGDPGRARVGYEAVARRWPQSVWAPFAKERLEELAWREQRSGKSRESSQGMTDK